MPKRQIMKAVFVHFVQACVCRHGIMVSEEEG